MSNLTVGANAAAMPNRRTALGMIGGTAALGLPAALADRRDLSSSMLTLLITAHGEAREAFIVASDVLEGAEPDGEVRVQGIGVDYALANGKDRIAGWIEDHFRRLTEALQTIARSSPALSAEGLALLESDRGNALRRLDEAFAASEAAKAQRYATLEAEEAALLAVCAHRCGSMAELARKVAYLDAFRVELTDEKLDALFGSLLPAEGL